jgi:hypothetical protein
VKVSLFVTLAGADAGGPRRQYLTNVAEEIYAKLKMFIKSPNAVHNVGEEREKWVPNPKANSKTDLDNFYKLGIIIGLATKLRECLEISLPSIAFKYILSRLVSLFRWSNRMGGL